jgi:hypothetical protein
VWDYTQLQPLAVPVDTVVFTTLGLGEVPSNILNLFPELEVAVVIDTVTTAFNVRGGFLRMLGIVTPSATALTDPMNPNDTRPVEVVFGGQHTDAYSMSVTVTTPPISATRGGLLAFTYDGYGELRLPGYNVSEVARTVISLITTDTLSKTPAPIVLHTRVRSYNYQNRNTGVASLVIDSTEAWLTTGGITNGDTTRSVNVRYAREGSVTSVEDDLSDALRTYPNPTTSDRVRIDGVANAVESVMVSDVTGRTQPVPAWSMTAAGLDVRLPDLAPGAYTLVLKVSGLDRPLRTQVLIP